ncbi:TonB-dependent receptor [Sphingomonas sp. Root241]|uniref:TonB-dependent receptor n=1 Tax=Sphingomonas sp. Root241 TaxID=1736501 RepID=UPI0006F63DAD|nr:TonB-dependent receptor [Sphingomonas sp. Root241]KRC82206.1 TonB-dependent receptor [Sphingomonas sp. Root241]
MKGIITQTNASGTRSTVKLALFCASSLVALTFTLPALASSVTVSRDERAAPDPTGRDAPTRTAQNETPDAQSTVTQAEQDEIVVTGIRGSLQRNLDAKREASGVVDVISSEDIGKFPDSNVAASLQRLPGVSIQRDGVRGEANGVTIRGFGGDFNETLVDGRRLATATGGRSIDFSTVGSDFIGALTVYKTPDVTVAANSIGATIDIAYPKPLDHPGFRLAASASGSIQNYSKRIVPSGGLLISDSFADDSFGILASVIYTRHDTRTNNVFVHGFPGGKYAPCQLAGSTAATCNPTSDTTAPASQQQTIVGFFEQQYGAQQSYTKDERIDGRIAIQWQPSDDLLLTVDNNYSDQRINTDTFGFGIWFNQGSLRNVKLDDNGVPLDFTQAGSQTDFTAGTDSNWRRTNQTGLNVKWDATQNLEIEADGSLSRSWLNPDGRVNGKGADVGYGFGIGPALGIAITGDSDEVIPSLHSYGVNGDPNRWADMSAIGSHVTVNIANKNTDTIKQGRLRAKWTQDDLTLSIGGSYVDDTFKFRSANTFANNFWQAYSGYGPASGTTGGVAIPANLYRGTISTDGFIPGFSGTLPPTLINFSAVAYQDFLTGLGNPQATTIPGYNYGCCGTAFTGTFDVANDVGSYRNINEKTWSLFLSAKYKTEIAGMPFHFNAGVRQESTKLASTGVGRLPTSITPSTTDPTLLTVNFGPSQEVTTRNSYSYLLPAVDMKLELTPKLVLRFDASRTLTRPTLNLLTPVLNIGSGQRVGALTADGGNPLLQPYLADNFDVAAEWYYQRNSYASVNFFLKNVSNFIVQGTQRQTINGVVDPSTGQAAQFSVSQRVNGPDATVRGVELALQHTFGDSGFGFIANGTFVETNKPYDRSDISQSGFAVTGLANSANFVGFFDKYGFEFRAALNWRDEYLLQFGQVQNTGAFGAEPTFVNASTQVDLSASYQITENINVFGEALNITNETMSTHGRYNNQLLDVYGYGRRFTAGLRIKL